LKKKLKNELAVSCSLSKSQVCNEKTVDGPSRDTHMKCNILSRPCCIGVKGECQLLTKEHCDAKRGYFHPNATLCSQVGTFSCQLMSTQISTVKS